MPPLWWKIAILGYGRPGRVPGVQENTDAMILFCDRCITRREYPGDCRRSVSRKNISSVDNGESYCIETDLRPNVSLLPSLPHLPQQISR